VWWGVGGGEGERDELIGRGSKNANCFRSVSVRLSACVSSKTAEQVFIKTY